MRKNYIFRGVGTALATPFLNGEVDLGTFGKLIDMQKDAVDALIVAGTTGEAPTLSEKERDALLDFALSRVNGKIPIIMGTGTNDTAKTVTLSRRACELGADGLLVVTPYYNRGTKEGIKKHFLTVAEASSKPIIVYNVPSRTGGNLDLEDYRGILSHPNIMGVKEAHENSEKFLNLTQEHGETCAIYTGSDAFLLPSLALGGDGVISVLSHVVPHTVSQIYRLFNGGKPKDACVSYGKIANLCHLLFRETSPAPLKEALRILGYGNGECRLPLTYPSAVLCGKIKEEITLLCQAGIT